MSDYNFYGLNSPSAFSTGGCVFSGTTITITNAGAGLGDVIYFKISESQGAVGVCIDETNKQFKVDTNVYSSIPSSFTPTIAYRFDVSAGALYSDLRTYRLENKISLSTYSESYRAYNTSVDFLLIVDSKKREYNGSVKTLITTEWVVFKDGCENHAYLVSSTGDTFVTLNNKFKSELEFNIATR